jgi:hypothetical protein
MMGVSTRQLDQLLQLALTIGNRGEAEAFLATPSSLQLEALVRSNPGLETANLAGLFNTTNQLDAFIGLSLDQWIQSVENPQTYYRDLLIVPAIARIGASYDLSSPAISYLQWYTTRTSEDRNNLTAAAPADLAHLLSSDWLGRARERRLNIQGLAAASQDAQSKAAQAQTLADQAHVHAQLQSNTNAILLETAAQAVDAQEAAVRAADSQNLLIQEASETQRNSAEIRLDLPP